MRISLLVLGSILLSHGAWAKVEGESTTVTCPVQGDFQWSHQGAGYQITYYGQRMGWSTLQIQSRYQPQIGNPSPPVLLPSIGGGYTVTCNYQNGRYRSEYQLPYRNCAIVGRSVHCNNETALNKAARPKR